MTTWAEDRATVGTDPSADPGAKTEGRADRLPCSARSSLALRDWHQSDKSLAAISREQRAWKWSEYPGGLNFERTTGRYRVGLLGYSRDDIECSS
jgi:hypothetical protein